MKIPVDEIQVREGRRELDAAHVRELADSIKELGLLNPITVDKGNVLIAGLHRLEAVKLLEWPEVECTVSSLEGLRAELAELDENFVRNDLTTVEYGDLLLRRKEIYEALHPETKRGMRNGQTSKTEVTSVLKTKSFAQDTAKKLGVAPRTIERKVQAAKNLTPGAKEIVKEKEIGFENALKISRLEPEKPASVPAVPYLLPEGGYTTIKESVAALKNPDIDCSCTPDSFLAEFTAFVRKYLREIEWYSSPYYEAAYPSISPEQLDYLRQQMDSVQSANGNLINQIERNMKK